MQLILILVPLLGLQAQEDRQPRVRVVDLSIGEEAEVTLCNGEKVRVKVLHLEEVRDDLRSAVRIARVKLLLNEKEVTLVGAPYVLPVKVAGVQVDCPATRGNLKNAMRDDWGLEKDVRIRLWPKDSPWISPGTFVYPVRQRWFASQTQMANEPVDGGQDMFRRRIYYHAGLDIGGAEGRVDVVSATDGVVVTSGNEKMDGADIPPMLPAYDAVSVRDKRGWVHRYFHFKSIDGLVRPGKQVRMGQRLGTLGKGGSSGGWAHLHYDIMSALPSGKWGLQEGYPFIWEAYRRQYAPGILAVARPHHLIWTGEKIRLDGSRSWSASGEIVRHEWTFSDGSRATGSRLERTYERAGRHSEVLKVTDARGRIAFDFTSVLVVNREEPLPMPPWLQVVYSPTFGVQAGDAVTFQARSLNTTEGHETWDFGDGSAPVVTRSDGNVERLAPDGFATVTHRYRRPGTYVVRVRRTDRRGQTGAEHVVVHVGEQRILRHVDPDAAEGLSRAVVVGGSPLVHTTQILPEDLDGGPAEQSAQVLSRLSSVLAASGSDLHRTVKLNVYVSKPSALKAVRRAIRRAFPGDAKPAVAIAETPLPHAEALVAMDAVAVAEPGPTRVRHVTCRALPGSGHAAVLPPGARVHLSGEPGKGSLAEATRQSLTLLGNNLAFVGLNREHVVQVKAFLQPMTQAATVRKELARFFGDGKVPPSVFVEWQSSKAMPIEIELIAWAGLGGDTPGGSIEFLTPPGFKPSSVFTRIVRVSDLPMVYVSGLYGNGGEAEEQIRDLYGSLRELLVRCGSDLRHLVKGTYYPIGQDTSRRFTQVRRETYDPKRPPAASKALVDRIGRGGKFVTIDMIAAVPGPGRARGVTTPFGGRPHAIPGTVEAEHFDEGPAGRAYHDTDRKNHGTPLRGETEIDIEKRPDASNGHGIGWTRAGEWILYTVDVKEAGTYAIEIPVASKREGGLFHLEFDGKDVTGPIRIPDTGGWETLKMIRKEGVHLEAGVQLMRLVMESVGPSRSIGDIDLLRFIRSE